MHEFIVTYRDRGIHRVEADGYHTRNGQVVFYMGADQKLSIASAEVLSVRRSDVPEKEDPPILMA